VSVEHRVSCSAGLSTAYAVDVEITADDMPPVPDQLSKPRIEAARRRRDEALARLQLVALTDEILADLLVVLGLEDE
jgi:hypothetical protein